MATQKKAEKYQCECGEWVKPAGRSSHERLSERHKAWASATGPQPPEPSDEAPGAEEETEAPDRSADLNAEIERLKRELAEARGEVPKGPTVWPKEMEEALAPAIAIGRRGRKQDLIEAAKQVRRYWREHEDDVVPLPGTVREFLTSHGVNVIDTHPPTGDVAQKIE